MKNYNDTLQYMKNKMEGRNVSGHEVEHMAWLLWFVRQAE